MLFEKRPQSDHIFFDFAKNGPIPASFLFYFRRFNMSQFKYKFKLIKALMVCLLGIQTQGIRMEGADESIEEAPQYCYLLKMTFQLQDALFPDLRVATSSFTTYLRSSATRSLCKCSCLLATSSAPRFSSTGPPIRVNASVRNQCAQIW